MATAADVQTAYKAINRTVLNSVVAQSVADAINNGTTNLDAYIQSQLAATASTTQAAVAISAFVTGLVPTSAHLDALTADAVNQVASYTKMGSSHPELGAFEAFGKAFAADASTGFAAKYGALSSADFINAVYASVFGANPSAAAFASLQGQIDYFVKLYTTNGFTAADAALQAKGAVMGQIVGYAFTSSASANSNFDNQVAGALAAAAKGDASVYGSALSAATGTPGSTYALTTAVDVLTGTANNDTFIGTINVDPTKTTLNLGDNLDGGIGNDSLNIVANAGSANALAGVTIRNIENININGTAGTFVGVDLNGVSGVTNVNATGTGSINVANIGNATLGVVGVTNNTGALQQVIGNGAKSVFLSGDSVGSAPGSQIDVNVAGGTGVATLAVSTGSAATISNLIIGGGSTVDTTGLAITAAGNLKTAIFDVSNKLQTVTVSGAATSVDIGTLASTTVKSVDASGLTAGGVKVGLGANLASTFLGGAGNDTLTIAAGAVMTGTYDAGQGTDTLALSTGSSLTSATGKLFTNFETLQVSNAGAAGTTETYDPTLLTGITSYKVAASTGAVALTNLAANPSVTVTGNVAGTAGLALVLKDATGSSDVASVTLDNGKTDASLVNTGLTVSKLTAVGVETVNIHSAGLVTNGGTANTVTNDVANTSLSKVTIDGSANFTFTTGNVTKAMTIDGSAATGALTLDASAAATVGVNINGGSGNDTINAAAIGSNLISGGKGGDAIMLAAPGATDTIVFKAASDSLQDFVNPASKTTMDSVTNFASGTDKIDLTSLGITATTARAFTDKTFASTAALQAAEGSATFFQDATNITRGAVAAHIGGDTYLIVDADKSGTFDATHDLVVKLTGTGALVQTDLIWG